MTGFARTEGSQDDQAWTWEVRSVNAKGLDVRFRPAPGFESLDPIVRKAVAARFKRGSLSVNLSLRREAGETAYRINDLHLARVLERLATLAAAVPDAIPPSLDGILGLRGVIEPVETTLAGEPLARINASLAADLEAALDQLARMRGEEGLRLATVLEDQIAEIEDLTARAAALSAMQPEAIRARLNEQVGALIADNPALPEERLAQEAALLMTKADMREELDRLVAHVAAARDLIAGGDGAVGRRFDFLCQEFNREANTLCSKSPDTALTNLGLELKTVIDQLREQVQNIE